MAGGQRRFAAAGGAGDQHASPPVGLQPDLAAASAVPSRMWCRGQAAVTVGEVVVEQPVDQLGDAGAVVAGGDDVGASP